MNNLVSKILGVGLSRISPKVKDIFKVILTKILDFLELHFNNIVKHLGGIGGAGLGLGLATNLADTIIDGSADKFSYFSRLLGLNTLFSNLSSVLTPYMSNWDCTFLQAFASFGGVDAINTIVNSCAYALLFWLCVVVFKWVLSLIPLVVSLVAHI